MILLKKNKYKSFNFSEYPILTLGLICFCLALIFGTVPFSTTGIILLLCVAFIIIVVTFWQSKDDESFKITSIKAISYVSMLFIAYCIMAIQQKIWSFSISLCSISCNNLWNTLLYKQYT